MEDVVVGFFVCTVAAQYACLDGTEGSSGSHSPLTVAIWAYLALVMAFVLTPCAAAMESRPPELRVVRVVHSFTGRVLLEATHPRLGQVRVLLLKQWAWDKVRSSLPDGYSRDYEPPLTAAMGS